MISVYKAEEIIKENIKTLGKEIVNLEDSLNRVLFKEVYSKDNIPNFDNSTYDGYALNYDYFINNQDAVFEIIEVIPAGKVPEKEIFDNKISKIMTGAMIPKGCDLVIMKECANEDENRVTFSDVPEPITRNIRYIGEVIKSGELLFDRFRKIRPYEIGLLAECGISEVEVFRTPSVSILSSGDELIDVNEDLSDAKKRNSNIYSLYALISELGLKIDNVFNAKDDIKDLTEKFQECLKSDIIVSTGAVSVGDFDFLHTVLRNHNANIFFNKVKVKPGKPFNFGIVENKLFFGLPGNPVSTVMCFVHFVKPALMKISGYIDYEPKIVKGILATDLKAINRTNLARVIIKRIDKMTYVYNAGSQASNMLSSLALADGYVIVDENSEDFIEGRLVDVISF